MYRECRRKSVACYTRMLNIYVESICSSSARMTSATKHPPTRIGRLGLMTSDMLQDVVCLYTSQDPDEGRQTSKFSLIDVDLLLRCPSDIFTAKSKEYVGTISEIDPHLTPEEREL